MHHAGPRDEGADDDERERERRAHDAPALEAAATAIHGEAVDEGERDHPGQEARILDRIPCPVTAPAEHDVGPYRAEPDADAEEQPAEDRIAVGTHDPFLAGIAQDERRDGVCERNGEARVAHEERRRMNGLRPMLEQRRHAGRVRRRRQVARLVHVGGGRHRERHVAFGEQRKGYEREQDDLRGHERHVIHGVGMAQRTCGDRHVIEGDQPGPE